ncbi:MAG: peptidyl-prolyl cis-trans isomerase [Porticoccaceae bacterium]|jgi:hypothetical protein|nr:peptidyl-prolyl cis-trans isomerase [Porticoccaceae bacterium]MDB2534296.1 peptidylprolyl isomerase [Porticoccaceae bacterium]
MKKLQPYPLSLRILALVLSLLTALLLSFYWVTDQPSQRDWDADRHNLPDIDSLQQRIQSDLFDDKSAPIEAVGTDIDQIMDPEAMDAKLAGLTKNVTTLRQPTEQELIDFYRQHQADYREFSNFSFRHLLFSSIKYGGSAYQQAEQILSQIRAGQPPTEAVKYQGTSDQVAEKFGSSFADKLLALTLDSQAEQCWTEPTASKLGVHLVCIDNAVLGKIPSLEEVRSQVINDWRFAVVEKASD